MAVRGSKRMFSYAEAGEVLDVGVTVVKQLVKDGHLRAVKVGGSVKIRDFDLNDYIDNLPPHSPAKTATTSAA